jgi:histidinol-phosphate aminotransferase
LRALGVRTYPSETYFFLADFSPHNAAQIAEALKSQGILVKPLQDPILGEGFMRITTALPEDNLHFVEVLRKMIVMKDLKT